MEEIFIKELIKNSHELINDYNRLKITLAIFCSQNNLSVNDMEALFGYADIFKDEVTMYISILEEIMHYAKRTKRLVAKQVIPPKNETQNLKK